MNAEKTDGMNEREKNSNSDLDKQIINLQTKLS
jgi:hypothetical protein